MFTLRFFGQRRFLRLCSLGIWCLWPLIVFAEDDPNGSKSQQNAGVAPGGSQGDLSIQKLLDLDIGQLSEVPIHGAIESTNLNAPSARLNVSSATSGEASSTGELLRQIPGVSVRRLSGLNLDPQIRGYHASQLVATANGMNQLKSRVDIDSLLSQIDPGVVKDITVIDGPYTSLYGPGFAFLLTDLTPPPRFATQKTFMSTNFFYGANAQSLYARENVVSGAKDWGVIFSYGLRSANDYLTGGTSQSFYAPSGYQKWDGMFSASYDVNDVSRIEFDYLRTDMNDVELPGIAYDVDSSVNNQFNLRYIIQKNRKGPKQLELQAWWGQTYFHGDSLRPSKQTTFVETFLTQPLYFIWARKLNNVVNEGHLNTLGVRALKTFGRSDSTRLTIGADWRRYQQTYHEQDFNFAGDPTYGPYTIFGIPHSLVDNVGVLGDLWLPLSEQFSLNVGGRVDTCRTVFDPQDPIIPTYWQFTPGYEQPTRTLGMAYATCKAKLSETATLKGGVAFAMRMPNPTELYSAEPLAPLARFGNSYSHGLSTLEPEKNIQIDLGLSRKTETFSWGVRGYFSMIRDYIMPVASMTTVLYPSDPPTRVLDRNFQAVPSDWRQDLGTPYENADYVMLVGQYVNIDLATLLGGDLYGEYNLTDRLAVYGTMSYTRGTNESPVAFEMPNSFFAPDGHVIPLGSTEGLPNIYPLNGVIGVRLAGEENRWGLDFNSRMVRANDHVASSLSEVATPGFVVFNLRGYYKLGENITLNAEVQNLFNRFYYEPGSLALVNPRTGRPTFLPEPGINCLIGINARF